MLWKAPLCLSTHFPFSGFHPVGHKTSIQKMHMCVQTSMHIFMHAHIVHENTWRVCLRACAYACIYFSIFFCSLREIYRLDATGWLCTLRTVSVWIMGAGDSARGSWNSKCVKRQDCPRSTRNIVRGLKCTARDQDQVVDPKARRSMMPISADPLWGRELQIATQESQQLFPSNWKYKSA